MCSHSETVPKAKQLRDRVCVCLQKNKNFFYNINGATCSFIASSDMQERHATPPTVNLFSSRRRDCCQIFKRNDFQAKQRKYN